MLVLSRAATVLVIVIENSWSPNRPDWQQSPHNKPKHESCNTCESRRDSPTWSTISRVTTRHSSGKLSAAKTPHRDESRKGHFKPSPLTKRQSSTHRSIRRLIAGRIDRNSFGGREPSFQESRHEYGEVRLRSRGAVGRTRARAPLR